MARILLPFPIRARLKQWATAGYPLETCGVLIGRHTRGAVTVVRAVAVCNISRRPRDRFHLHGGQLVQAHAEAEAEARGLEIVGIWHSHPDHPAEPSDRDRAGAWRGWTYLILSVTGRGVTRLRCWRPDDSRHFREEALLP